MRRYSVIVPVYNRPEEIDELLKSLCLQTRLPFEVLVIEDGSTRPCNEVISTYESRLNIRYFVKENSGQGFSRNFGFEKAEGDYFIVFDSDCIIPPDYFEIVDNFLEVHPLDAYGGPDKARDDFTPIQKAISYSMTSPLTTGGIRGNKKHAGTFHPRSFNMGIARKVYETLGGFKITRMGEDIEFSIRIINAGFKSGLINEALVYHKRRTSFVQFFKQLRFFGRARINVSRYYPDEMKFIHLLPLFLLLGETIWIVLSFFDNYIFLGGAILNAIFVLANFTLSLTGSGNLWVAALSVIAAYVQLLAYGTGLLTEGIRKVFSH